MMMEQIKRQQAEERKRKANQKKKARMKASEQGKSQSAVPCKYYCPFCYDITSWEDAEGGEGDEEGCLKCEGCKSESSLHPERCTTCKDMLYVYRDKGDTCAKCAKGLGPKDVIGFKVMLCIFCKTKT